MPKLSFIDQLDARQIEYADKIDLYQAHLLLEGNLVKKTAHGDTGVVEQNVHASASGCIEGIDRLLVGDLVADIQLPYQAIICTQFGLQRVQTGLIQIESANKPALLLK